LLVTAIGDSVIRLVPPLIIDEDDCDAACGIIGSAIEAISED
jgi:acetylornithine/N-succinyldiaminopimelate aminotransferase